MTHHTRRDLSPTAGGGDGDAQHPTWEVLNDLVDGRFGAEAEGAVRLHLAECRPCRSLLEGLEALGATTGALPRLVEPPADLWGEIAATITTAPSSGVVAGVSTSTSPPGARPLPARPAPTRSPYWLAAAAILLMALSSSLTALYLKRDQGDATALAQQTARQPSGATVSARELLPASFSATESAYLANVSELEALLATQRAALSPATITVVEQALATIDAAIAEARAALVADPANQELAELLGANYRQKVELLRRAAEFPQSL